MEATQPGTADEITVVGDWDRLVRLFERASPMTCSHWNAKTGEVFHVRSSRRQRDEVAAFELRLFDEEGWIEVPFLESDDAFALMRSFAEELAPGRGRSELLRALDEDKPFRGFRQVLKRRPGLRRRWQRVADDEARVRLVVTCLSQGWRLAGEAFAEVAAELEEEFRAEEQAEGLFVTDSLSLASKGG